MIYTFLADGFEEIEALAIVDILRRAEIDIELISVKDDITVCGAHGICVNADKTISEIDDNYDAIFLPGGYPGYVNLSQNKKVTAILKDAFKQGRKIIAICAAPSILGELGFLSGKEACCFTGFEEKLLGAKVTFDDVCVSDNIITSRGAGTAHSLGFALVEIFKGKKMSDSLKNTMLYK